MAARFIDIDNFTGFYEVNEDFYNDNIVEKEEEKILRDLLGNTLYDAFIADLDVDNDPQTQKWIDFKDGVDYTDSILIHYTGIIEMLVAFAFYALIIDNNNSNATGFTKNANQNSRVLNEYEKKSLAYDSYNRGVNFYVQSERYLSSFPDDYEEWYHKTKTYKHLIDY
jgi:hypothetical protein